MLNRLGWNKFSGKLFIILTSLTVATVVILTVVWISYAWKAVDKTVQRDMQIIAKSAADQIDEYLSSRLETIAGMRELLSYPDEDRFKLSLMLKRIDIEFKQYEDLSIYDASNKVVASSKADAPSTLSSEIFDMVKGGKTYRSQLLFTGSNMPYIRIAMPLFWQGEVFRILVADIDITEVWNKVDGIRLGRTGFASIISEYGIFLAHRDKKAVLQKMKISDLIRTDENEAFRQDVISMDAQTVDGKSILISLADIEETGWKLVICRERWEVFEPLFFMIIQAVAIMVLALLAGYYISTHLSRLIAGPIEELHKGMEEIAKHNYDYKVPELYGDELAVLYNGVNSLAISLREKEELAKKLLESERMASIGRLAASVSHEVNNPLAIIKNYIFVLSRSKMSKDDPNQKYMKIMDAEIDRISRIIRDFNELYKGNMVSELKVFDVSVPLNEVITFCKEVFEAKGIEIETKIDKGAKVKAEHDKMKQVFLNLIKNAGEAMPNGGSLTVATRMANGRVYISISDTGTGIKPEHISRLFEPFFSTKGVKGMGLGLSVTYGYIKNFGGDMTVESQEGKGTTFTVMMPVLTNAEIDAA